MTLILSFFGRQAWLKWNLELGCSIIEAAVVAFRGF